MQSKKTPKEAVELCEAILLENGLGGIVIAQNQSDGYYGVSLMPSGLMQWTNDDTFVKLSLNGATTEQIEQEWGNLSALRDSLEKCQSTVRSLAQLLHDGVRGIMHPEPEQRKRYDN